MVVIAIMGVLGAAIIISFPRSRVDLSLGTNLVISAIRLAQTEAVSSTRHNNIIPCGYGFHQVDASHFAVYVGPNASTTDCGTVNKNYQSNEDTIIKTETFQNTQIQFSGAFNDIFFEPPDPKTYLDNDASLNQAPISITVKVVGTICGTGNCKVIHVYPSGKIEAQ